MVTLGGKEVFKKREVTGEGERIREGKPGGKKTKSIVVWLKSKEIRKKKRREGSRGVREGSDDPKSNPKKQDRNWGWEFS